MAYLGANDAAFRLGNQAVSVYLGAVEVYSPGATLYFNGAVDDEWTELGNWWQDAGHTVAAGQLPAEIDSVVSTSAITASGQTVVDFTTSGNLSGTLTVTGVATFNGSASLFGTLNGQATFTGSGSLNGTVNGTAVFAGTSQHAGTVTSQAIYIESGCNAGGSFGSSVPSPPPSC